MDRQLAPTKREAIGIAYCALLLACNVGAVYALLRAMPGATSFEQAVLLSFALVLSVVAAFGVLCLRIAVSGTTKSN